MKDCATLSGKRRSMPLCRSVQTREVSGVRGGNHFLHTLFFWMDIAHTMDCLLFF